MTDQLDLDGLERLAKAATPGPWEAEDKGGRGAWIKGETGEWSAMSCGDTDASADANAALIVAAVNAIPALISQAREAERMRGLAKDLCFIARTSGGDQILMAACDAVEAALAPATGGGDA